MTDEKENAFVRDLCKAQSEMDNALFNKTNPHFKSKYADFSAVRAATKPALTKHGFAMQQKTTIVYNVQTGEPIGHNLITIMKHVSGETEESEWFIPRNAPQQEGSNLTYGRRYNWSMLTGIASEEDDDAERATDRKPDKSAYQARLEGFYPILERELRAQTSLDGLKQWWSHHQHELKQLPPHQLVLAEEERDRNKLRLADEIGAGNMSSERLRASLVLSEEENEVIEGSSEGYLDDLDGQMAGAKDEQSIMEVWNEFSGIRETLSPADQDRTQMIFERHMRALKASSAVKAMRDSKKK